jgi:hypothetical protein
MEWFARGLLTGEDGWLDACEHRKLRRERFLRCRPPDFGTYAEYPGGALAEAIAVGGRAQRVTCRPHRPAGRLAARTCVGSAGHAYGRRPALSGWGGEPFLLGRRHRVVPPHL